MVLVGALVCVSVQACGPMSCTLMGGLDGIYAEIPEALYVSSGEVLLTVCSNTDCASATKRMGRMPQGAPARERRAAVVTFADLARTFPPGEVKVTVELRGSRGQLVAERSQMVELERHYPNGEQCDDGFVSGHLFLRADDRV